MILNPLRPLGKRIRNLELLPNITALADLSDVDLTGAIPGDILYYDGTNWIVYHLGVDTNFVVNAGKLQIGDIAAGDYFEVSLTTGNVYLFGDATAWDDFRIEASVVKPGVTAPNWKAFGPSGSLQALMFEANHHDEVHFDIQLPHNWKEGTDVFPHVHWTPNNATAGNVVWELEYAWTNVNAVFGAPSNIASAATAAGGVAWTHKLTTLLSGGNPYISGAGKTLSSMLKCRIHRNSNAGSDTLNQDVSFLEFDIHYRIDSFGSDQEYIK